MKLGKMKDLILALVVSISVIMLVQYVGERVQVTKEAEASSIMNLEVAMTKCVERAKAAWQNGMNYPTPSTVTGVFRYTPVTRDDSTAIAILAAEIFKERIGAN